MNNQNSENKNSTIEVLSATYPSLKDNKELCQLCFLRDEIVEAKNTLYESEQLLASTNGLSPNLKNAFCERRAEWDQRESKLLDKIRVELFNQLWRDGKKLSKDSI